MRQQPRMHPQIQHPQNLLPEQSISDLNPKDEQETKADSRSPLNFKSRKDVLLRSPHSEAVVVYRAGHYILLAVRASNVTGAGEKRLPIDSAVVSGHPHNGCGVAIRIHGSLYLRLHSETPSSRLLWSVLQRYC